MYCIHTWTALLAMLWFDSEPWFEPEPLRTEPKFGPKFALLEEPDLWSSSWFRIIWKALNGFEQVRTHLNPWIFVNYSPVLVVTSHLRFGRCRTRILWVSIHRDLQPVCSFCCSYAPLDINYCGFIYVCNTFGWIVVTFPQSRLSRPCIGLVPGVDDTGIECISISIFWEIKSCLDSQDSTPTSKPSTFFGVVASRQYWVFNTSRSSTHVPDTAALRWPND